MPTDVSACRYTNLNFSHFLIPRLHYLSIYLSIDVCMYHKKYRHYVPAIAHRIWQGNQSPCETCDQINFAGLAIGNGLTAPEEQYKW